MAKKTRKQKQRAAVRRGVPQGGAGRPAPVAPAAPAAGPRPAPARPAVQAPAAAVAEDVDVTAEASEVDAAEVDAADLGTRRRIQRINPAAAPRPGRGQTRTAVSAAALFQPLDPDDAAIPFDRVPYVPRDLRRVAIMAVLMVMLILIAAFVVTRINP